MGIELLELKHQCVRAEGQQEWKIVLSCHVSLHECMKAGWVQEEGLWWLNVKREVGALNYRDCSAAHGGG